jgi:diguanylate cyclase (GGDEF)-like protein/PAS domain S-box-containing protein
LPGISKQPSLALERAPVVPSPSVGHAVRDSRAQTIDVTEFGRSANVLARRAMLVTLVLVTLGSGLGMLGVIQGTICGVEGMLISSCLLFSAGTLLALLLFPNGPARAIAAVSTVYFGLYLCAGAFIAIEGNGQQLDFFVYLIWFFPLLAFNRLVNAPAIGTLFSKGLLYAPLIVVICLAPRLLAVFGSASLFVAYCLSYICFSIMLNIVSNFREKYLVERERAEALRLESEVFESISDCFCSLDSSSKLIYMNDAACNEFRVERNASLRRTIADVVPIFYSQQMEAGLQAASDTSLASTFEAPDQTQDRWYEMRCFPRPDGMSLYFRNITEAMRSRRTLEAAQNVLREQAKLLDKAQDAIFVQDMGRHIIYWNKGAERLYGWTAEEATGRRLNEILPTNLAALDESMSSLLASGEWDGELIRQHRNGCVLRIESRCTLLRDEDGSPRSILAINTDITTRKAAEERIHHLAFYDALTELPNRQLLRERLDAALCKAIREGSMGALLFIDLDDFKTLNDTLGHDVGDLLIKQVAVRLSSCVNGRDIVARLGGDEFVVMLEGLCHGTDEAAAQAGTIGHRILAAFVEPYNVGGYEYKTTASVGITLFPAFTDTVDDLLKRADLAMYRAKANGRNTLCFFDPAMQTFVASRAALQTDLRQALINGEFELHYQPQVGYDGRAIGAEALLRWRHPSRGMVSPAEFISLAEESTLIIELGRWALHTACAQLALWAKLPELQSLSIAVNVSFRQFIDPNFVPIVRDVIRKSGADARRLKLELTESSVMENAEETIAKMDALKACDVGFSLDDFGTGYSSLSHLKHLPLDQLKIDRSFVRDVLTDAKDASIARAIITLGHNLNLSVLAEGVETEAQRAFLEREGCHAFQGFLFSPALPADRFEAFVIEAAAPKRSTAA